MSSPATVQLENDLQCQERHQFLSSPQDSNTSALSYQEGSSFFSPVTAPPSTPAILPRHRTEVTGPSPLEVPTEAIWDTDTVACHGKMF